MPRGNATRRGFTLVEVLVALAIVSIGMLVIIQAVSQTANNTAYLRDKTIAHWVAMNQLTLMRISQTPPTKGSSNGETEMGGLKWKYTADVSPTAVDSMLRIDIGVRAADAEDDSQLASVTGFIGTKISKPGTLVAYYSPVIVAPGSTVTTTIASPTNQPGVPNVPTIPIPGNQPPQQPLVK